MVVEFDQGQLQRLSTKQPFDREIFTLARTQQIVLAKPTSSFYPLTHQRSILAEVRVQRAIYLPWRELLGILPNLQRMEPSLLKRALSLVVLQT